jgi:hypothetical protein
MGQDTASAFAKLLEGLKPIAAVPLFVGFVVFLYGLTTVGFTLNPPLTCGIGLMVLGFALHYCHGLRYDQRFMNDVFVGGEIKKGQLLLAILLFCLAAGVFVLWFFTILARRVI